MVQKSGSAWVLVSLLLWAVMSIPIPGGSAYAGGGTWIDAGTLNSVRYEHTATLLADGRVLVAGGRNAGGILGSAELYQSQTHVPIFLLLDD